MKHREAIVFSLLLALDFWVTSINGKFVLAGTYSAKKSSKNDRSDRLGEVLATNSVKIKRSGRNSLIAKEKALSVAARRAFSSLLHDHVADFVDLGDELETTSAPMLKDSIFSDREISNCVYDYSIENEKHSEFIYICEVRYRFDSKRVVSLLRKHGLKCRLDEPNNSSIRVAVYTRDFILNSSNIYTKSCVVQKYSSDYVILLIRNCTKEEFEKLGLRYALL